MATTPRKSIPISSFASSYVPLDLVRYMKSGDIMPFHVFNQIVMPDFLHHLGSQRKSLLSSRTEQNSIRARDHGGTTEEDNSSRNLLATTLGEIQENLVHIHKACKSLEQWETDVNEAISQLVLRSLDDAFKDDSTDAQGLQNPCNADFLLKKFGRAQESVSKLKEKIYLPLRRLFSGNLNSESFKSAKSSVTRKLHRTVSCPVQSPDVNIGREILEPSRIPNTQAIYDGLKPVEKKCLLCFSVFPENAVIKKKVLVHWWIGEEFIDCSQSSEDESAEKIANRYFDKFIKEGIIEPVYKKQRPSADSCKMQPFVRNDLIKIAKREEFAEFDNDEKYPTANISGSARPCLVKTEKGLSIRDYTYGFQSKQDQVQALFNVNERCLEFKVNWFSKMKNVKVLQLGNWQGSASHLIEVVDSEFLKGLKKIKLLRYLSLRGVSRITELPKSICKLRNLVILNLNGCHDLEKLPNGIGSLKKLTHLDMYGCSLISHMPKGIARLSKLQILKGFVVAEAESRDKCCRLEDLTKLEYLKKLSIHVNNNISDAEKGKRALSSLSQFGNLQSLSISWSRIYKSYNQEKGMQRMISHVKRLASIERSRLTTPSNSPSLPAGLKKLNLHRSRLTTPSNSPSLPAGLKKLNLHYFPGFKISDWFSLVQVQDLRKLYVRGGRLLDLRSDNCFWRGVKFLRLKYLNNLRIDWEELQQLFPKLSYLEKWECPQLSSFPCDAESGVWKKKLTQLD